MRDLGKRNLLGVLVDAIDYDAAVERIVEAAQGSSSLTVTALAVHGVMTGKSDAEYRYRLNDFDLVAPDGQPVRWALNLLYRTKLTDRIAGPELMLRVLARASAQGIPVFLYGSTREVLDRLAANLSNQFPGLRIVGTASSGFRSAASDERSVIAKQIEDSGARITFVGLGCPRQEIFAYEFRSLLSMPLVAVGAAFDFHAGMQDRPPMWVQRAGLEWLVRLVHEPKRLWRRYVLLNPAYIFSLILQATRLWRPNARGVVPPCSMKIDV